MPKKTRRYPHEDSGAVKHQTTKRFKKKRATTELLLMFPDLFRGFHTELRSRPDL
jgi:hypothetical protein